jgi:hypothetical protein
MGIKQFKNLGTCEHCGANVVSKMDSKDHTVGEAAKLGQYRYKAGDVLGAA